MKSRLIILDGGLATELEARGYDLSSPLWSAQLLLENPDAIAEVHRAYLEAGARCLISASYQASRRGFAALGVGPDQADELIGGSVQLARRVARDFGALNGDKPARVAVSCGPFGAVMHDGSEYTGQYGVCDDELMAFHAERLPVLLGSGADWLACETIPSLREARILADLLRCVEIPAWVSVCCRDDAHLSDGTPIEAAASLLNDVDTVFAVGVNCTAPQHVERLIQRIAAASPDKQIVVYPNSGERYCASDGSWSGERRVDDYADRAERWVKAGASLIGGCCRVGPAHIAALAARLPQPILDP